MPKPNYAFQKRQRELAKKQKKEAKQKAKAAENQPAADGSTTGDEADVVTTPADPSKPSE